MKDEYDIVFLRKVLGEYGYSFDYYPETESTMNIVHQKALDDASQQHVVLTDHQTKGAGRHGRAWTDKSGCSIMFSALFRIPPAKIASFADLIALRIAMAINQKLGINVRIKYPNDLVVDNRKTGGILVKNIYNDKLQYLGTNVGVGINVHYNQSELKKFETDYPAESLDSVTGKTIHRQNLLVEILEALRYLGAEVSTIETNLRMTHAWDEKWKKASSLMGKRVVILKNDKEIHRGNVVDTGIGRGVEIKNREGSRWFSLFDTDMKVRVAN